MTENYQQVLEIGPQARLADTLGHTIAKKQGLRPDNPWAVADIQKGPASKLPAKESRSVPAKAGQIKLRQTSSGVTSPAMNPRNSRLQQLRKHCPGKPQHFGQAVIVRARSLP